MPPAPEAPPPLTGSPTAGRATTLVIGCGALGRELLTLVRRNGLDEVEVRCLPAGLHNRPERIAAAVEERIRAARDHYRTIFVAYGDCGTGGALDRVIARHGVERLPGAHCYEIYAGAEAFARLADEEPGTFYLTDFLARSFERLVISGLGLDRHPELQPLYFARYRRLVYLSQRDDPELLELARRAAARLGLAFEHRPTGYGDLEPAIAALRSPGPALPAIAAVPIGLGTTVSGRG